MTSREELLKVSELTLDYGLTASEKPANLGASLAVNKVSFSLERGEVLGLVGESGSGKSSLAQAILQLHRPTSGQVFFEGTELTQHWKKNFGRWVWNDTLRAHRQKMQLIFQDPKASLNPRMTVRQCIEEPLRAFRETDLESLKLAVDILLQQVGLDSDKAKQFPHELSGGQSQRVVIARALALKPRLIIADEPVSSLDVSVRGQVLNLLTSLRSELGLSYLYISHDLSTVRHICDRVAVMYRGKIVEEATVEAIFSEPQHPQTRALVAAARM